MDSFDFFGNVDQAENFVKTIKSGRSLLSLVISYTETCEIPGITFAGSDKDSLPFRISALWVLQNY